VIQITELYLALTANHLLREWVGRV